MNQGEVVRARVDHALSKQLHRWASAHHVNISEAVRVAVRRLVEEQERKKQVEKALREFERSAKSSLFDRPEGVTKAGGFR